MRCFTVIWRWIWPLPLQRPDLHLVFYTRRSCPLCDKAWELLYRFQRRHGFVLESQDVDAAPELVQLHGSWVPVVMINGRVRFRGHVNPVLLQRIVDAQLVAERS